MIDYIGVVSREDAELLQRRARLATRVLEFGAGASTQIFAAYCSGMVECVETDQAWIDKTVENMKRLGLNHPVTFHRLGFGEAFSPCGPYDLIFVDGPDKLRLSFALATWPHLVVGGSMLFHDTRRTKPHGLSSLSDVQNVCRLVEQFSSEVDRVVLNQDDSNTTVVTKRAPLLYVDWMQSEGRTLAQMGLA